MTRVFVISVSLICLFFVFSSSVQAACNKYSTNLSCAFGPPSATCSSYNLAGGWAAVFTPACTGQPSVTQTSCDGCSSESEARSCACGGGAGLTKPTCSILTNKTTYNAGDPINITINAGDNKEVYGGSSGVPATAYPTLSGSGCGALVGFCSSTNLCTTKSPPECSNVCKSLRTTATNPTTSSRSCTISMIVSNGVYKGANSGTCSTTVTVVGNSPKPNLTISSFSIPSGPPNSNQTATVRVTNSGSASTGSGFSVGVRTRGGSGTLGCNSNATVPVVSTSALPAGQSRNVSVPLTLPANPGTNITGGAMVDYGCVVNESNESDNKADDVYDVVVSCDPNVIVSCGGWSSCSAACGAGTQSRSCTNQCEGTVMQSRACIIQTCCDPNVIVSCGGWSSCSAACGAGTQSRSCTNQCEGTVMQSRACIIQTCCVPVSPAAPTLSSPPNGATNVGPSTNFSWGAPASWGNACPQPNNIGMYLTLKNSLGTNILGPRLAKGLATTHAATLVCNTSYNWYVEASNGGSPFSSSSTFSFRTPTSIAGLTMNSASCTGGHCIFNWSTNPASPTGPTYTLSVNGIAECSGSANSCDIWWKTFPAGSTVSWKLSGSNVCGSSTISGSVAVPCYGAFVTITNTDNSCSGKSGLGISGGFQMGSNAINSNQAYTINFSSGGSYDVIPATYSVSPTCTGEAGPANISCVDWPNYFKTFGGNVTAASGTLEDRKVPAGSYIAGNILSQPLSAGVVFGNSITPIEPGGGSFSARGFNLTPYQTSGTERKGTDYESLLIAALKYGGYSLTNMPSADGVTKIIGGQSVKYSYWSGSSLNSALNGAKVDPASVQIILPGNVFGDPVGLTSGAPLSVSGKHIIAFVPASVNISQRVTVANGSDSTFTLISSGGISVIQGSVDTLSGTYLFQEDFKNTSSATPMDSFGQIYAVGPSSTISLQRQAAGATAGAAETFNYQGGKYLKVLTPILTRPKTFWLELAPQ